MRCASARRYALSFLEGELGHEPAQDLKRHFESCAACRARLEGERALESLFCSSLGALEGRHREAWQRARAAVLRAGENRRPSPAWLVGAIAVLLVLGLLVGPQWRSHDAARLPQRVSRTAEGRPRGAEEPLRATIETSKEELTTMKPTSLLGAAVAVSVVSAASTSLLLDSAAASPEPAATTSQAEGPYREERLGERLEELARRQATLEESIAELGRLLEAGGPAREPVVSASEIERLVAQALERREISLPPIEGGAPLLDLAKLELAAILRELSDPELDEAEKERIWARVRASGEIDAVVAAFERRAEARPNDSLAQSELGTAYLHKMATVGGGREAGHWGGKGAAALEQALALDETNWDARFTLARHYSYADMRGDSIRQFEVLVDQQEARAPRPAFAQTYLWLGNLYLDQGDRAEALRTWSDGLRLFPSDEALRARLRAFE